MKDNIDITEVDTATKQDVKKPIHDESGNKFALGNNANPSGKGGFGDHPENRANGSWKKENTPRGRLEKLINATSYEEFITQIINNKEDYKQTLGNVLDSALIDEVFIIDPDHPETKRVDFDRMIKLYEFVYGRKTENDTTLRGDEGQAVLIKGFVLPSIPGISDDEITTPKAD